VAGDVQLKVPQRVGIEVAHFAWIDLFHVVIAFHVIDELLNLIGAELAFVADFRRLWFWNHLFSSEFSSFFN
jgi:hypothetical protein